MTTNEPSPPETVEVKPCPSGHTRTSRDNNNIYGSWWVKCADGECSWRTAGETEAEAIAAWNTRSTTAESASCEVLREALEPFVEAADDLDDNHPDRNDIWESATAMSITAGDLRRARAAIAAVSGGFVER